MSSLHLHDIQLTTQSITTNLSHAASYCQKKSHEGIQHAIQSWRFLRSQGIEEISSPQSHVEIKDCELFATHFPLERQRAEFMASKSIQACKRIYKDLENETHVHYQKHVTPRIETWSRQHPRLSKTVGSSMKATSYVGSKLVSLTTSPAKYLFTRPSESDIHQGNVGDCYYLAALSSIAYSDPKAIKDNIRPHLATAQKIRRWITGDTTRYYDVCLHKKTESGAIEKVWITVDNKFKKGTFQNEHDAQIKDHDGDGQKEIWAALYEKAYFKMIGNSDEERGRNKAHQGGTGIEAYTAIYGKTPKMIRKFDNDTQLKALLASAHRLPMVAGIKGTSDSIDTIEGLPGKHMYTVLGIGADLQDNCHVILRNPWGHYEPNMIPDGIDDGTFKLPLETFKQNCMYITTADKEITKQVESFANKIQNPHPPLAYIKIHLIKERIKNSTSLIFQRLSFHT